MLASLLSSLLPMIPGLNCLVYLQYVFPFVLFVYIGTWAEVIIVLYYIVLVYNMMDSLLMKLIWSVYSVLSPLCVWWPLRGDANNCTLALFSQRVSLWVGSTPPPSPQG